MSDIPLYTAKTPCVGLCSTVYGDLVCRGCKRFSHEIIDWNRYSGEQKAAVWRRLEQFLEQVMLARMEIVSPLALRQALVALKIPFIDGQPAACQAYRLLTRAVDEPFERCGVRVRAEFAALSRSQLREEIDQDYFRLSEAYYQRRVVPEGKAGTN